MRALLIANPNATTTDERIRDVLVSAISSVVELTTIMTSHRGHAGELAARAATDGTDVVLTLGGDGTVHEVVNGLLNSGESQLPALGTIPGGSANVFARACGLPNEPITATGEVIGALRRHRFRRIGLGRANGLWFTCNAGIGLDAEVIASMEQHRSSGRAATPTRYVSTALREYFGRTDRKNPALTVLPQGEPAVDNSFLAIVQNCSPWTYLASLPVNACPQASFETGLDVMAIRDMRVLPSLRLTGRLLRSDTGRIRSDSLYMGHDLPRFAIVANREVALQVDGEGLGHTRHVTFESVPNALRILDCRTSQAQV